MKKEYRDKMANTVNEFGQQSVRDIKLEDFDADTLFLDRLDLDTHVVIHSGAVAWYGYQYKKAVDELKALEDDYNRWKTMKIAEAEAQLLSKPDAKSPTIDQKLNRFYANCDEEKRVSGEDSDTKWKNQIKDSEETVRLCKFWVDGFQAKNYNLKLFSEIRSNEGNAVSCIKSSEERSRGPLNKSRRI